MNKVQAVLVFLMREEKVLLAMKKRGFGQGRWNGVGGKIEPGETVEAAAIRETEEEIGVRPSNLKHRASLDFNFLQNDAVAPWTMKVEVFICTDWEGDPRETEEMRPQWFEYHDIPYDEMWVDDEYWLPQFLAGKSLVGTFDFIDEHTLASSRVEETPEPKES